MPVPTDYLHFCMWRLGSWLAAPSAPVPALQPQQHPPKDDLWWLLLLWNTSETAFLPLALAGRLASRCEVACACTGDSVGSVPSARLHVSRIFVSFSDIAVMGRFEFVKRSVRVQTPHSIGIKHCFYPLHTAQLLSALFL